MGGVEHSTLTLADSFPDSPLDEGSRSNEEFEILGRLGAGGMGVVHLALQRSVDRLVALKTLKEGVFCDLHKEQLVREGWVLGELAHPNIPPIYTMTTYQGSPAIAFKCVQGEPWSKYLRMKGFLKEVLGVEDEFEWHLGVLLKVVDAVRFAHSHGTFIVT